jgi:Sortilin, neurotensin receptor 3,
MVSRFYIIGRLSTLMEPFRALFVSHQSTVDRCRQQGRWLRHKQPRGLFPSSPLRHEPPQFRPHILFACSRSSYGCGLNRRPPHSSKESDTFLSTDGGVHWKKIRREAHEYEFGEQGSILVAINNEEGIDSVNYSTDFGDTWFVIHGVSWSQT